MSLFQQQKTFRKIFYSWVSLLVIFIFLFVSLEQIYSFYYKDQKIKEKLEINNKRIEKLNKEFEEKNESLNFLQTERGQEGYYRETYAAGNPNEKVFILYNSSSSEGLEIIKTEESYFQVLLKKIRFFIDNYTNL